MAQNETLDVKSLKNQLIARRDELLETSLSTRSDRNPVELDQAMQGRLSRMDALQQREMALATQRRRDIELLRIESALKRIKSDDYGYCVSCDEDIAFGRLEADPAEPMCVECARNARR